MDIKKILSPSLTTLANTLSQLSEVEYTLPCKLLNGSTIGAHTRHIIELFQCVMNGYENGTVNYDERKRDNSIETNNRLACQLINDIVNQAVLPNKELTLLGSFVESEEAKISIPTNYFREIVYNLEHTIHHMALIRIGIKEISDLPVSDHFGVAASTLSYQKTCVQ